jgi:hypothetical protein
MTILYIVLGIIAVIWIALTGFALLVNFFSARGNSFWKGIFHRCTPLEVVLMSPGLLFMLPLAGASWAIRSISLLRK